MVLVYTQQELLKEKMNLSGECVGHRMDEKLLWGQAARILPRPTLVGIVAQQHILMCCAVLNHSVVSDTL